MKNHRELAEHAHQQHANDADEFVVETINFQSLQDYQSWKLASEESDVISRFTAKSETTEFGRTTYLRCHCSFRAGSVPAKTKKSVEHCTAYMNVREKTDGVTVEHCLTHIGHEARPSQLRLDNNAEQFIVSLLRDGLTIRQVYNKRRVDANLQSNGIQFYRPARDASGDGFVQVVINPTQKEWLRKYGQRALCVDDTFNLTSYSLRLATAIVADEWDRALPAAYLLSYSKVFPSSWTKRLLCLWHVQQAMKRNAIAKLVNRDLSEPFLRKMRDICLVRERSVFVTQYTSMLKYLLENDESTLASYMENTWSNRMDQWAAFGRLGSCVSTSMLCERFHKKLKHEMLEGKANVRIDRLLQLLIALTTELEEDREIMKERGVEEGRYRLQQHHKANTPAVNKYCGQQQLVTVVGLGTWELKENGRRSQRDGVSSVVDGEVENEHNGPYSSDGDEEMMEVVVEDDVKNESVARSSTELIYAYVCLEPKIYVWMYASTRESMLKVMRELTEGTGMEIEQVLKQMDKPTKRLGLLAENVGRNGDTARRIVYRWDAGSGEGSVTTDARRHDVPSVGCPQALTPIRKLHKRAHLRKAEQAKRKPVLDIPDCAQDERDACAVCLRMQPITGSTNHQICWIQCPTCEDWMHTDCISKNVCPRDGAELRRSDV
ncbi:hypothetical protein RB195_009457 [Necator americanus]|uniref:MULE transposase domain-containing protein n=1 Tax=Necator americanus TaxID=51031 RepID=A0ABR1CUM4_NECAM